MVLFLTHLFGGPNHYKGPDMVTLHKNMAIKQVHFDITWEHMDSAFRVFKVNTATLAQIREVVYTTAKDIVNTV
jgi:truncated hemoglobin YjbI